ncbi:MAG TPA: ceramide glucosyltransferase [Anaeromyxobacter sp.]
MAAALTSILFGAAAIGLVATAVQVFVLWIHLRAPAPAPRTAPAISILKPLCGVDDGLEENLASFAALDWPDFEVVLGVRSSSDAAYPLARAAVRRWPGRFRAVLQRGAPGLNPKVNQLLTLARAARHELLVISDSNVRVEPGYLSEIAALLEDERVGMVTNPISGEGEAWVGSLMDHLHLASWVTPAMIAGKRLRLRDIVVGKSMALRRRDLEAMGGFDAVRNVLAEDYVMGQMVASVLGKRVAVARTPVRNVSARRSLRDFVGRYERWAVLQRHSVGRLTYSSFVLSNPVLLAALGAAVEPTVPVLGALGGTCVLKIALDAAAARLLRPGGFRLRQLAMIPAKDLAFGAAWAVGLFRNEVAWRGNKIVVGPGTRIVPLPADDSAPEAQVA